MTYQLEPVPLVDIPTKVLLGVARNSPAFFKKAE
jgi:hypothetical protein